MLIGIESKVNLYNRVASDIVDTKALIDDLRASLASAQDRLVALRLRRSELSTEIKALAANLPSNGI